ncbi:MAG: energy transducer TonB [Myxococcales bacterium]|nr:energy transducer TonB [Myxococcales bacterium]
MPRPSHSHRSARPLTLVAWALAVGASPAASARSAPYSLAAPAPDEDYTAPVLKNQAAPIDYPAALLELDPPPAGQVIIKYVVGVDGVPRELEVTRSVHPELDALARRAVGELRYEPGTYKGQAVEVVLALGLELAPPAPEPEPPAPDPAPDPVRAGGDDADAREQDPTPADAGPVRVSGTIRSAGQRTPIDSAVVLVVPAPADAELGDVDYTVYNEEEPAWTRRTLSGLDGSFEFRGLPDGKLRVIVLAEGHNRVETVEELLSGKRVELDLYPKPLTFNPYRTVIRARKDDVGEIDRRTITVAEINTLPGTQGDALKAIQNFPGVARAPFGAGLLAVRGAAPGDSAVYLGYHEIPSLFHFGGVTSVFNSDILTQIDFIPGNFDSRYGDAIGGIVNVVPRKGRRDGFHGYLDSDLFDTGILMEGPVGKGSIIGSFRRSYIDLVLANAIPDDAGLNVTAAPRYYDYQLLFDYPVDDGELSLKWFGSYDRLEFLFSEQNDTATDDRDRLSQRIYFHRGDVAYTKRIGGWDFLVTPSFRHDFVNFFVFDVIQGDIIGNTLSTRAELGRRLSRRAAFRVGTELTASWFDLSITAPLSTGGGGSSDQLATTTVSSNLIIPALYTTMTLGVGDRVTLYPGARFSFYSSPFNKAAVDPRLRAAVQVGDRTVLKAGAGLYTQAPNPPAKWDDTFGNPDLGIEHALHTSVGLEHDFDYDIKLELTGFYKHLWHLSAPSSALLRDEEGAIEPELQANTGVGHIFGGELLARKALTRNLYAWLSYTLMRSTRRDAPGEEFYLFGFDQTHILTAIASYKLPRQWQIGARFRLVSGNPNTPIIGAVTDASSGVYIPIYGPRNSDRLPPFHQLDIRVDKRWIYRRLSFLIYLDILNVYNAQNTEGFQYSYDYQQRSSIASLPILPSIGARMEW